MTYAPAQSYVPPRPNLGPEPWPGQGRSSPFWILIGIPVLLFAWWMIRRKRTSVTRLIVTPIDTWQAAAVELRRRLAACFGPDWIARTSEEIMESLRAQKGLTADHLDLIADILIHADFIKFAGVESFPLSDEVQTRLESLWKGLAQPTPLEPGPR